MTSQARHTAAPPLGELSTVCDKSQTLSDPSFWDWLTDKQHSAVIEKITEEDYNAITADLPHTAEEFWDMVVGWEDADSGNVVDEIINFVEEMGTASEMDIFMYASELGTGYTAIMEYIDLLLDMKVLVNNNTGSISLSAEASNCGEKEKP